MSVRWFVASSCTAAWLSTAIFAPAAPEVPCPSVDALNEAVRKLAPQSDSEDFDLEAAASGATVDDLGARYRVSVAGRSRDYDDTERDCAQRARVAAVFVALVLWPMENVVAPSDETSEPEAPEPPVRQPPRKPLPEVARPGPAQLWLEAGAAASVGVGEGSVPVLPGVEVRVVGFPDDRFGVGVYGGASLVAGDFEAGPVLTELRRYPIGAAVRLRVEGTPFAFALDAGVGGAWLSYQRVDASTGRSAFEPALRIAATLALSAQLAPFISLHGEWSPSPHGLSLAPTGEVAASPPLWLGATLGFRAGVL